MIRQLAGVFVLLLLVWAFLNTPDQRGWQVILSALLATGVFLLATWLIARNFGLTNTAGIGLALLLTLGALWLTGFPDYARFHMAATWLASAATLYRKKPFSFDAAIATLTWLLATLRWIVIPLIAIPLTIRAGGGKPVRYGKFILIYLGLFLLGAFLPHYIIHWVPKIKGLWPELASMLIRFAIAYLLFIGAWVQLGRSSREERPY